VAATGVSAQVSGDCDLVGDGLTVTGVGLGETGGAESVSCETSSAAPWTSSGTPM
jgi:hypothetical protein